MQKFITVDLDFSVYDFRDVKTLAEMDAWVQSIRDAVPAEFHGQSIFKLERDYEGGWDLSVSYQRPEADADREADARREREYRERELAEEHRQFLRLKAKFEGQ